VQRLMRCLKVLVSSTLVSWGSIPKNLPEEDVALRVSDVAAGPLKMAFADDTPPSELIWNERQYLELST